MVPAWYQILTTIGSIVGVALLLPHPEVLGERAGHLESGTVRRAGLTV